MFYAAFENSIVDNSSLQSFFPIIIEAPPVPYKKQYLPSIWLKNTNVYHPWVSTLLQIWLQLYLHAFSQQRILTPTKWHTQFDIFMRTYFNKSNLSTLCDVLTYLTLIWGFHVIFSFVIRRTKECVLCSWFCILLPFMGFFALTLIVFPIFYASLARHI